MKSLYELFFYFPGRMIMWFAYFFPTGGFEGVAQSRRHYKEGGYIIAFMWSVVFWILVGVFFAVFLTASMPEEIGKMLASWGL